MTDLDCDIDEFTETMSKKHPNEIERNLDEESSSNALMTIQRFADDPQGWCSEIASAISKAKELGDIRFEIMEEDGDQYLESFLTLKDPCNESSIEKALELDFVWL